MSVTRNILTLPPENTKLNEKQLEAWKKMCTGENIFITGSGGTGKSLLVELYVNRMKRYGKTKGNQIAVTSTSGTSSVHIKGKTIHSYFQLGIRKWSVPDYVKMVNQSSWIRTKWYKIETLIIDEISMLHPWMFDLLEESARHIRDRPNEFFGGIQVILTGDFLQLPCVKSSKFCFESESWEKLIPPNKVLILTEIARQEDSLFRTILDKIRLGVVDEEVKTVLLSRQNIDLTLGGIKPTKIYTRNADVDGINLKEISKLLKDGRDSYNYDMDIIELKARQQNKINNFRDYSNVPNSITLCKDSQVMLIANLDITNGLANGSRGVVVGFNDEDLPIVKFVNGVERVIEWHKWEIEDNNKPIFEAYQIPLKVAYAITAHKSQSCTLDLIEVDLSNLFEYGQAYVILSRVRSLEGLSIVNNINWENIKASPKALEYYESIQNSISHKTYTPENVSQ